MTGQIPIFPKANSMFIHSGNIINWNRLKRKPNLSPTDELCDCINKSLDEYLKSSDTAKLQYMTELYKVNTEDVEKLDEVERLDVKITVKVFICIPQSPSAIGEAVNKVLNELSTTYVETVLLAVSPLVYEEEESEKQLMSDRKSISSSIDTASLLSKRSTRHPSGYASVANKASPPGHTTSAKESSKSKKSTGTNVVISRSSKEDMKNTSLSSRTSFSQLSQKFATPGSRSQYMNLDNIKALSFRIPKQSFAQMSLDRIKPYWEVMEDMVSENKVMSLGVCDLNRDVLADLYTWAKVKPVINQVNLQSCCVIPPDLVDYAKDISVQLLTHNDGPVLISKERLQETIKAVATERDSESWAPQWVVRYSGIIKCRGIIKLKGYIFHAVRENKKYCTSSGGGHKKVQSI